MATCPELFFVFSKCFYVILLRTNIFLRILTIFLGVRAVAPMEAIQRIVSRQLTDLSQKRQSHRLKADETSIFPMESHAESVVAFSSPFHLLDLETASNCKPVPETPSLRTSASTGSISSSAYSSNSLSSGRQSQKADDFATEWSMPEKQNRLQQPFKKVRRFSTTYRPDQNSSR